MFRLLVAAWLAMGAQAACPLSPTSAPRLPGDGGYRILISGDYDKYIPDAVYTVSLQGSNVLDNSKKFKRFTLSVDSQHAPDNPAARVGYFQIFPDSLTEYNEDCINTVSEVSDYPKSEVQVMWRAPPPGSGCVIFTGMVLEKPSRWYAEDGRLIKSFCEMSAKETESLDELRCCACDEAKYKLVLEGLWSKKTHPKDFPEFAWLTHFSDLVGASHETNFSFWGRDHVASDGFRQLAESSSAAALEAELKAKAQYLRSYIKAPGLWFPNLNSNTTAPFTVDRKHPLVSVASTLGPSPDWVVGVSKLNLCQSDCTWLRSMTIDLYPWDAGTDSGISYMSANAETRPRERMKPITTMYPEDPRSPFYDPSGRPMLPVARLYLDREQIIRRGCDAAEASPISWDVNAEFEAAEQATEERPECATTAYSEWSGCSVSCGKGLRTRTRSYRAPERAAEAGCNSRLVDEELCLAPAGECSRKRIKKNPLAAWRKDACETTDWNNWSECSTSCGIGFKIRHRTLRDSANRNKCYYVSLVETQKCIQPTCETAIQEQDTEVCKATEWSEWSSCSVSCGKGVRTSKRKLLVPPKLHKECARKLELVEHRPCDSEVDCIYDKATAKAVCMEKTEPGLCRASFERWTFDAEKRKCVPFIYGGCDGNRNNFYTLEGCKINCEIVKEALDKVDCQVSDWSPWTTCNVSCGIGQVTSYRYIKRQPKNGGKPCPKLLQKQALCQRLPCKY